MTHFEEFCQMDRAEEAAWKALPDYCSMDGGYIAQRKARANYIKGYRQAEKDIEDPIAWIKRISGEKEMARAKEKALRAYPPHGLEANWTLIGQRDAFEVGYLTAKEDLIFRAKQWIIRQRGFSKMALQDFQKFMEDSHE